MRSSDQTFAVISKALYLLLKINKIQSLYELFLYESSYYIYLR